MNSEQQPAMWERYRRAEAMLHRNVKSLVFNLETRVHWLPDSSGFWYRSESASGHRFMLVDAESGYQREAFDHRMVARALSVVLGREVGPLRLPFETFEYVADGSRMGFGVDDVRWECRLDGSSLRERPVPGQGKRQGNVSPSGRYGVTLASGDLVLVDHVEGRSTTLTDDAEDAYGYGSSPEGRNSAVTDRLGNRTFIPRVLWSPDERYLLTHRLDERRVGTMHLWQGAPPDGSLRPRIHRYRQALPGDAELPLAHQVVFETSTGMRTDLSWTPLESSFLTPVELVHAWWSAGSDAVFFLHWDRARRSVRLVSGDPGTGRCAVLVEEESETPIDLNALYYGRPNVWVSEDQHEIIWYSTRSGWGHLYLLDGGGHPIRQLTGGDWLVTDLLRVDEETRTAYFMGTGREASRDPYYHHLYAVSLDGGAPCLLTPEDAEHGEWPPWVDFSPDGRYFVDRFSRTDQPPRTVLRKSSSGELVAQVAEADIAPLLSSGWKYPERFTAKASDGQTDLCGMIVVPYDFDPAAKYPIVESIYAGPQATRTPRGFTDLVGESTRCLADLGFVVFTIDGSGTPGRSKALHDAPFGRYEQDGGLADHVAVLAQLADTRPYIDLDRVGIYGHSAGAYAAVRAMLEYPDLYRVGVASSGNHDQALTNVTWGERWVGRIPGPGWDTQANRTLAGNLRGKLLLVTGDLDDNVNPAATLQLVDALIDANRDFDLLVLPNRNHDYAATWGTWHEDPYFTRRRWDYFVQHLLGEQPPAGYQVRGPG